MMNNDIDDDTESNHFLQKFIGQSQITTFNFKVQPSPSLPRYRCCYSFHRSSKITVTKNEKHEQEEYHLAHIP